MQKLALVAIALTLFVAPAVSAQSFQADNLRIERVERITTRSSVFETESLTPRVTVSETLVLEGHAQACSFTVECHDNGTFDATFQGCTATQAKKIFEAAAEIC